MQLKSILTLCTLLAALTSTSAQNDVVPTPMRPFTLYQSRLSAGAGLDYCLGALYVFKGELPPNVRVARDTASTPSYFNLGAYLELYSPHSRLNFSTGIGYGLLNLVLENKDSGLRDKLSIEQVQMPFNMRYVFGKKYARANPFLLLGGSYNLPLSFKNGSFSKSENAILPTHSVHAGVGVQLNFRGTKKVEYGIKLDPKDPNSVSLPTVWGQVLDFF